MGFVLWHDGTGEGYDRCVLRPAGDGAELSGTAVLSRQGPGVTADYRLYVDRSWRVVDLAVRMRGPAQDLRLRLTAAEPGRWARDGVPQPGLAGCLDVDLDFTPVGLTPLIRRLALAAGERRDLDVVTVRSPELVSGRARVGVERQEADRWMHHAGDGRAAVHVGPQGLVTEYEGAWTAVALG